MLYQLVIGSVFKNESHIMREWLDYYLNQGVEHFYLVNNASSDNYLDILKPEIDRQIVTLLDNPVPACQLNAYNQQILPLAKKTSNWLLIVDFDEFVYQPHGKKWIDRLNSKYRHFGGVASPWIFFGSSGYQQQPEKVVDSFKYRWYYGDGLSVNVKNFYQTRYVEYIYPHHAKLTHQQLIVSSKSLSPIIDGMEIVYEDDLNQQRFDFLTNHYAIQSLFYFKTVKMTRGDIYSVANNWIRDLDYFNKYDKNEILDLGIQRKQLSFLNQKSSTCFKIVLIGFPSHKYYQISDRYQIITDQEIFSNQLLVASTSKWLILTISNDITVSQLEIVKSYTNDTTKILLIKNSISREIEIIKKKFHKVFVKYPVQVTIDELFEQWL